MSFNREDYLRKVLLSLRAQRGAALETRPIALFQDGGRDAATGAAHAKAEDIQACIAVFKSFFPTGTVHLAETNLGVAMNYDRAERYAFEQLDADCAIFLEDDLVLSPDYLATLDTLIAAHAEDARVGYLSAYGDHRLSAAQQAAAAGKLRVMHHNWGFALYRRQWLAMRPYVEAYLQIVGRANYRHRDDEAIRQLFASWGFGAPATSQDSAKTLACCLTRSIKINTTACFAKYIGERGLHMNPAAFAALHYADTELFPHPIAEFEPLTDLLFHEIRADLINWAGRPKMRQEGTRYDDQTEKLFHQVNALARDGVVDAARALAIAGLAHLFRVEDGRRLSILLKPRNSVPGLVSEETIRIEAAPDRLTIICAEELVTPTFTNSYHALVLAADIVTAATAGKQGAFFFHLGAGLRAPADNCVAFSAPAPHKHLVMDPDFYASRGYEHLRGMVERHAVPWRDRKPTVFWRGSSTGRRVGAPVFEGGRMKDWAWLQRLHLCDVAARSADGAYLDVGLSAITQIAEPQVKAAIKDAGFLRGPVLDGDLPLHRHVIVADGNSSAGSGLLPALLSGACVLIIGSVGGLHSWFYQSMVAWKNYVPIRADLGDFDERVAWAIGDPTECEKIAARGHEVARWRDFASETERARHALSGIF